MGQQQEEDGGNGFAHGGLPWGTHQTRLGPAVKLLFPNLHSGAP